MTEILKDMQFEKLWDDIPPDKRDKFIALQVFKLDKRVGSLEASVKGTAGIVGLASGGSIALFIAIGEYILRRIGLIK